MLVSCGPLGSAGTPTASALPRWVEYQTVLSYTLLKGATASATPHGLCEWEIWGQNGANVYVWALCQIGGPGGPATSAPAVIHLGPDGHPVDAVMPRDSYFAVDVPALFPTSLQARIWASNTFDGNTALAHLAQRFNTNGPPLIAELATPLP